MIHFKKKVYKEDSEKNSKCKKTIHMKDVILTSQTYKVHDILNKDVYLVLIRDSYWAPIERAGREDTHSVRHNIQ